MAKMAVVLPDQVLRDMRKVHDNTEEIFGAMTKAGAEVAYRSITNNAPEAVKSSKMIRCLKVTRTYRTPTDGGINNKVGFYGYFQNENGETVPAPLVANVFEYGRSNSPFPKQPFFRHSFNKGEITKAMLRAQEEASGGLLK